MLFQPHVQSQHGRDFSVWKLWLSPVPPLVQPGVASRARPFCGQEKNPLQGAVLPTD